MKKEVLKFTAKVATSLVAYRGFMYISGKVVTDVCDGIAAVEEVKLKENK